MGKYPLIVLLLATCLLAACQRQNEIQLTLIAQNATLQAEIGNVRETATVDAERLQITVDYVSTLAGRAQEDRVQLQATLVSRGTEPASIESAASQLNTPFPPPNGDNPDGFVPTPPAADSTEAVAPTPSQPALVDLMMAPGVGSDDCALSPTTSFTTDTAEIYVVATGVNISPGTNIAASFSVAGQEIRYDFTPDFAIDGACLWFFIDQTDLEFRPGTWSVQLELNGAPASPPIPFTITGEDTTADFSADAPAAEVTP